MGKQVFDSSTVAIVRKYSLSFLHCTQNFLGHRPLSRQAWWALDELNGGI